MRPELARLLLLPLASGPLPALPSRSVLAAPATLTRLAALAVRACTPAQPQQRRIACYVSADGYALGQHVSQDYQQN